MRLQEANHSTVVRESHLEMGAVQNGVDAVIHHQLSNSWNILDCSRGI